MNRLNKLYCLIVCLALVAPCASASDFFSKKWLRNYPKMVDPESLQLLVDQEKRSVEIRSNSDVVLLRFLVPKGIKLEEIVVNRVGSKAVVLFCKEGPASGGAELLKFMSSDGSIESLNAELGNGGNRIFVSEIGAVSESGRYLLARCGIYQKRADGFVILYKWRVLDLFDKGKIVSFGIDDWVRFIEK